MLGLEELFLPLDSQGILSKLKELLSYRGSRSVIQASLLPQIFDVAGRDS